MSEQRRYEIYAALAAGFCWLAAAAIPAALQAEEPKGVVLIDDHFDREESDPNKEEVGNGWGTNSKTRAKGVKQVDLVDGAMHITRAAVADHGVSVTHEAEFRNALIGMRFKIGSQDDFGVNIADMKEKSVHAGHICMVRIRPHQLEIADLKTGRMNLGIRNRRLENKLTEADKQQLAGTAKQFRNKLTVDEWHRLEVRIVDDLMSVAIDGNTIGEFRSPGIGHPTKSRIRLAVNREAWVDDVRVVRLP